MMLKAISIVVIKRTIRPDRKSISAVCSNFFEGKFVPRMAKNDNKQLVMKRIIAKAAPSSIKDDSLSFEIFTEVNTMKQKPIKLAEVFKICGDLSSFIYSASSSLSFLVI